jgi:hypothetical protein
MDKLPVRHDDGPARRALDVDGPIHRSFVRLESNGRQSHTVEIRVATVATGSLSAGGKAIAFSIPSIAWAAGHWPL